MSQLTVVVGQRGWVTIGYLTREGDEYKVDKSRTIIQWGTADGLGLEHLAEVGPTKATKCSKNSAKDRFHVLTPIRMLECTPDSVMAWEKVWSK